MTDTPKPLFDERHYIGYNKSTLSLRMFLALFCFVSYYYTDIPEVNGDLLFFLGVVILAISVLLLFVTHIHTVVTPSVVRLTGVFGAGKVEIPMERVRKAEVVPYSKYIINNPVFNLHRNGEVRFYTGGSQALRITMDDGKSFLIGTHKPEAFLNVITEQIKTNRS